jgi:hypothetical protein
MQALTRNAGADAEYRRYANAGADAWITVGATVVQVKEIMMKRVSWRKWLEN